MTLQRTTIFFAAIALLALFPLAYGQEAPAVSTATTVPAPAAVMEQAAEPFTLDEMDAPAGAVEAPSMSSTLVRLILIMLLLFALLFVGLMAFQRISRRGLRFGDTNRPLRVVDKLTLGPKHSVCLINTCGRYVVLGLCEKEINVLMEVTPSDPVEEKTFLSTLQASSKPPAS